MDELMKHLPPMLYGDELKAALSVFPTYDRKICHADMAERLTSLSDLYQIYMPTEMSIEIYSKLYLALLHSVKKKTSISATQQIYQNYHAVRQQPYLSIMGGTDSFTIIGTSGIGKSTAVCRALSLLSENGIMDSGASHICPCIVVQCPFDSSVKGLLLEILRKVDEVLNSSYYEKAIKSHATTDMLIGSVSQVALNHIGLLLVDEIQNVVNNKNGKLLVGALTQLINNSGISIGMIGTPQCSIFFEQAMQLARRSLGLRYEALSYGNTFRYICEMLWGYQYVKNAVSITESIVMWLYEHSGGIISVVVALIHDAQEIAILNGTETLNMDSLEKAYQSRITMLHAYIHPTVAHGNTTTQQHHKKTVVITAEKIPSIEENCISEIAKVVKTNGLDIIKQLSKRFVIEEVSV